MTRLFCFITLFASIAWGQQSKLRFYYDLPADSTYRLQTVEYMKQGEKSFKANVYRPVQSARAVPVVVFFNGVAGDWMRDFPQYTGWGALVTSIGFAGVTLDASQDAVGSFDSLMSYLKAHAADLNIDPSQVVVYACSANVTTALPMLMQSSRPNIKAGVIYYGYSNIDQVRRDLPLLYVRSGLDAIELNSNLDRVTANLLKSNANVSVINYAGGQHGFEIRDDNAQTRAIILATLDFMRAAIKPDLQNAVLASKDLAEAAALASTERHSEAAQKYRELAQRNPANSDIQHKLGTQLAALGDHKGAITAFEKALELGDPNVGFISYAAATSAMKIGDHEKALTLLARLKRIPPAKARLKDDPTFSPLKQDPRFLEIISP